MKKIISFLLIAFIMLFSQNVGADYQKEINIYVSPLGSDTAGNGSIKKPYKTVSCAEQRAKSWINSGAERNINIIFRAGEYYIPDGITIDYSMSPNGNATVIYKAYNDEMVTISGGEKVSEWKEYKNGIYMTEIGSGQNFLSVYEGDKTGYSARFPNRGETLTDGYLKVKECINNSQNEFGFTAGDFPTVTDQNGLMAYIWPGGENGNNAWISEIFDVNVDYSVNKVSFSDEKDKAAYVLGTGTRYYLCGAIEFLDTSGEFYYNNSSGILYYKPYDTKNLENVYIPTDKYAVNIIGRDKLPVKNIKIEGIEFRYFDSDVENSNKYTIISENCKNVEISNCRITLCGRGGVLLKNSSNCSIKGNAIENIGRSGIRIEGNYEKNAGNIVSNNYIRNVSKFYEYHSGIAISKSDANIIEYNNVSDLSRSAISIGGGVASKSSLIGTTADDGAVITEENVYNYLETNNNIVRFNDLYDVMKNSNDGGVIYTYHIGFFNEISNNYIHDSDIHLDYGWGVYLDDESHKTTVKNNYIYNLGSNGGFLSQVFIIKGTENEILNNYVINCRPEAGVLRVDPNRSESEIVGYQNVKKNIFYNCGANIYGFYKYQEHSFSECDDNLYYDASGQYSVVKRKEYSAEKMGNAAYEILCDFIQWKKIYKNDLKSITAEPAFADKYNLDFRLQKSSPAYELGINDTSPAQAGLLKTFRYSDENDKLKRAYFISPEGTEKYWYDMKAGEKKEFSVITRTEKGFCINGERREFLSSSPEVASVDANGIVTALKKGEATVTVITRKNKDFAIGQIVINVD